LEKPVAFQNVSLPNRAWVSSAIPLFLPS
jgi:hypothetical protein